MMRAFTPFDFCRCRALLATFDMDCIRFRYSTFKNPNQPQISHKIMKFYRFQINPHHKIRLIHKYSFLLTHLCRWVVNFDDIIYHFVVLSPLPLPLLLLFKCVSFSNSKETVSYSNIMRRVRFLVGRLLFHLFWWVGETAHQFIIPILIKRKIVSVKMIKRNYDKMSHQCARLNHNCGHKVRLPC